MNNRLNKFIFYQYKRDFLLKKNIKNIMQIPELKSITLSSSLALGSQEEKLLSPIILGLEKISHQKPKKTYAKKSLAEFQLRKGQLLGCKVTLRSFLMYEFLESLILLVFPQIPDFCYKKQTSFSSSKDISFGFSQVSFFPEIERDFEILELMKGLNITISTSGKKKKDSILILTSFKFPIIP